MDRPLWQLRWWRFVGVVGFVDQTRQVCGELGWGQILPDVLAQIFCGDEVEFVVELREPAVVVGDPIAVEIGQFVEYFVDAVELVGDGIGVLLDAVLEVDGVAFELEVSFGLVSVIVMVGVLVIRMRLELTT